MNSAISRLNFRYLLCVTCFLTKPISVQLGSECRRPLGMQDKIIPDYYLTATSQHAPGTAPRYARLKRDEGGGAWCLSGLLMPDTEAEYLQMRLPAPSYLSMIATQGRFAHGVGQEFTRSYKVNYSRDGFAWFRWSNHDGVTVLQGNVDTTTPKTQSLKPGVAGVTFVRIIPVTNRQMPICLRAELYGCAWKSGLVSYDIPTPDDYYPSHQYPPSMLSDDTYDGSRSASSFTGGLGQLSDGIIGDADVSRTKSPFYKSAVGYDYVSWSHKRVIGILFRFDQIRNFTSIAVHCHAASGARIFSSMKFSYSLDGQRFTDLSSFEQLKFDDVADDAISPLITVPLHHLLARSLKVDFILGGGRLMFSEVQFQNSPLPREVAEKYDEDYPWMVEADEDAVATKHEDGNAVVTKHPDTQDAGGGNVGIIVGVLTSVIIILIIIVMALYLRQKKLRKTMIPTTYSSTTGTSRDEHTVSLALQSALGVGNGPALDRKGVSPLYHEIEPTILPPDNLYLEPSDVVRRPRSPPYQPLQVGEEPACSVTVDLPDESPSNHEKGTSHYAETDLLIPKLELQPIQSVTGGNIYAVPWSTPSPKRARRIKETKWKTLPTTLHGSSVQEPSRQVKSLLSSLNMSPFDLPPHFPRQKLRVVEKLGEGQFGEVRLCRADPSIRDLEEYEDDSFSLPGPPNSSVLVAVKVLRMDATNNAKEDFFKEVKIMSRLLHPNIVRLLAVCIQDEPFAMITEYMENGDLNQHLQTFVDDIKYMPGKKIIENDDLMKMACQIASGMEYLSSLKFVHRDLATRNCLVGFDDSIRIGDFGMSRNMYQSDYYRIQGKAVLPIRWMSWECVLMGKFSSAGDVWSFGVTLWEIYSLCKYQPYSAMNDQQVIENMHNIFRRSEEQVYLPRPKRCPASMFNMIRQCWKRDTEERPSFQQLHTYLLERQHNAKPSPKPKRPQVKPPIPASRVRLSQ